MESDGPFGSSPNIGVGFSDAALLVVSLIGFVMLSTTIYSLIILRVKSKEEIEREEEAKMDYDERLDRADVATLNRAQRRARAKNIMKRQRRVAPAHQLDEDGEGNAPEGERVEDTQHLSRKERQRIAKAAEREERRLYEDQRRKQQREAQEAAQCEREERERLVAERLEEERCRREQERHAREQEEYQQWRNFLTSVDGTQVMSVLEFQELVENQRVVDMNDLAERFRISTFHIEDRIRRLVKTRRLTGVVDSGQGRFVSFATDELSEISKRVLERGSVMGSDVVEIASSVVAFEA